MLKAPGLSTPNIICTMAIIDVVKWDAKPGILAWKFPSDNLSTWTQLIVSTGQEAFLVKEGKVVGPYGPGKHTLDSQNYPVFAKVLNLPFSRSPFTAEVWFIRKSLALDIKWGTVDPIQLEDPEYKLMLPVRAFGRFGLSVSNSELFLHKMIGTLPAYTEKTLSEHFKGTMVQEVKVQIARHIQQNNISLLKLAPYTGQIATEIEQRLVERLSEFGITITHFSVNSISTDDTNPAVARLRRALAERAEMDILGYNYHQKRSFDVLQTAAANEGAGNIQSAAIGAGMGLTMGAGIGQSMSSPLQQTIGTLASNGRMCNNCQARNEAQAQFCSSCGASLQSAPREHKFCSSCGTKNEAQSRFCCSCGVAL